MCSLSTFSPLQFIMLTYLFMLAWLGVTAFTSLPVYMYFNLWTICRNTTLVEGANLCLDLRQFGRWISNCKTILPQKYCESLWNHYYFFYQKDKYIRVFSFKTFFLKLSWNVRLIGSWSHNMNIQTWISEQAFKLYFLLLASSVISLSWFLYIFPDSICCWHPTFILLDKLHKLWSLVWRYLKKYIPHCFLKQGKKI